MSIEPRGSRNVHPGPDPRSKQWPELLSGMVLIDMSPSLDGGQAVALDRELELA
jgi:hypothetical protein